MRIAIDSMMLACTSAFCVEFDSVVKTDFEQFPKITATLKSGRSVSGVIAGLKRLADNDLKSKVDAILVGAKVEEVHTESGDQLFFYTTRAVLNDLSEELYYPWTKISINLYLLKKGWAITNNPDNRADFQNDFLSRQDRILDAIESIPSKIKVLNDSSASVEIKRAAIFSIGELGRNAQPGLTTIVKLAKDPELRVDCLNALREIGDKSDFVLDALRSYINSNPATAINALLVLDALPSDIEVTLKKLIVSNDSGTRSVAVAAFFQLPFVSIEVRQFLKESARDINLSASVRYDIVELLNTLDEKAPKKE